MNAFKWYRLEADGTLSVHADSPAVCALVDAGEGRWFGNPEGAILHAGVMATAYERRTVQLYDAREWLATGAMVPMGERVETLITAEPRT